MLNGDIIRRYLFAILTGLIVFALEVDRFVGAGFPYGGDGLSNLIPPWLVRHELMAGEWPIYTDLWYGGEWLFANPLFKIFYPLWWPTMIPGLPMAPAVKLILAMHIIGAGVVAFLITSRQLPLRFAFPLALILALPAAVWGAHTEKLLGWPYFILAVGSVAPDYIEQRPRHSGIVAGASVGVMLLTGDIYHAAYAGLLVTSVGIATVGVAYLRGLVIGGVLGVPKIVSLIPVLLSGAQRPDVGFFAFPPWEILFSLWGIQFNGGLSIGVPKYRYGTVGIPITIIALLTLYWTYRGRLPRRRYVAGVTAASFAGAILAGFPPLYWLPIPGIDILRTAGRATLLVGAGAVLLTWVACVERDRIGIDRKHLLVAALVLSAANGALMPATSGGDTVQPTVGREVVAEIESNGCAPVWVEIHPRTGNGVDTGPYHKQVSYALAEAGIPAVATSYGRIGQQYAVRREGKLTFEALIIGGQLNESISHKQLSGGWHHPYRGSIRPKNWEQVEQIETDQGPIYIYSNNRCAS